MRPPANPLKLAVLHILRQHNEPLGEHELIQRLKQADVFPDDLAETASLKLFQQHFLVMNALYQLQQELLEEQLFLSISPLRIELLARSPHVAQQVPSDGSEHALRDYYLDWQHFAKTDEQDVTQLLAGFWQRFQGLDCRQQACEQLGVDPADGWSVIQAAYRRQAAKHHPDRGGDPQQFLAVREAYELLASLR